MNRHDRRTAIAEARKDKKAFGRKFSTGYSGQNYKVLCTYNGIPEYLLGWTNDPNGGNLTKLAEIHPKIIDAYVLPVTAEERLKNRSDKAH